LGAFWVREGEVASPSSPVRRYTDLLGPGAHGTTYGGSPLACTVGLTTLGIILRDGLIAHAAELGRQIAGELVSWKQPLIKDIRAFGMMIGIEIDVDRFQAMPDVQQSGKVASIWLAAKLIEAGLLVVPAGPKVVRWLPPMNLTTEQATEALDIFRSTLDRLHQDF